MKKIKNGFTLIEMIIVIVIVAILAMIAVPMYSSHMKKATITEGKTLLKNIEMFEHVYFAEYSEYISVNQTNISTALDSESRSNKYFTSFEVSVPNKESFVITTSGIGLASGVVLTLVSPARHLQSYIIED